MSIGVCKLPEKRGPVMRGKGAGCWVLGAGENLILNQHPTPNTQHPSSRQQDVHVVVVVEGGVDETGGDERGVVEVDDRRGVQLPDELNQLGRQLRPLSFCPSATTLTRRSEYRENSFAAYLLLGTGQGMVAIPGCGCGGG